jgi:hypothetical protein
MALSSIQPEKEFSQKKTLATFFSNAQRSGCSIQSDGLQILVIVGVLPQPFPFDYVCEDNQCTGL